MAKKKKASKPTAQAGTPSDATPSSEAEPAQTGALHRCCLRSVEAASGSALYKNCLMGCSPSLHPAGRLLSRGTPQHSLCSAGSATNGVHEEQPAAEAEPVPSSGSSSPEKDQQAQADLAALSASHRELKATHGQLQTELQKAQQQLAQAEAKEAGSAAEKATVAADKAQQELQAAEDKSAKLNNEIAELREQSQGAEGQLGMLSACMREL